MKSFRQVQGIDISGCHSEVAPQTTTTPQTATMRAETTMMREEHHDNEGNDKEKEGWNDAEKGRNDDDNEGKYKEVEGETRRWKRCEMMRERCKRRRRRGRGARGEGAKGGSARGGGARGRGGARGSTRGAQGKPANVFLQDFGIPQPCVDKLKRADRIQGPLGNQK
jgi:hypothetical protein